MPQTVHTIVPVAHPARRGRDVDEAPLFCGTKRTPETLVTMFADHVTCGRCGRLNARYNEDLDYQRNQQKLRALRQIGAGRIGAGG